jgi:predicted transglutaminase-like cysteine proteinase
MVKRPRRYSIDSTRVVRTSGKPFFCRERKDTYISLGGACVDSNVTGYAAARQLHDIIEDAKAQNGLALVGHINRAVNLVIKPVTSSGWLSPLEAINSGGKAYSIAKYFALREAGIAADHLRLVIVHARSGNHMVVAVLWQDRWFILDNLTLTLVPDLSDYEPLLVLDTRACGVTSPRPQIINVVRLTHFL